MLALSLQHRTRNVVIDRIARRVHANCEALAACRTNGLCKRWRWQQTMMATGKPRSQPFARFCNLCKFSHETKRLPRKLRPLTIVKSVSHQYCTSCVCKYMRGVCDRLNVRRKYERIWNQCCVTHIHSIREQSPLVIWVPSVCAALLGRLSAVHFFLPLLSTCLWPRSNRTTSHVSCYHLYLFVSK